MGIDAAILVKVAKPKTAKEIRRLSFEMCEAFGHDKFMLRREDDVHALRIVKEFHQDGPTIKPKDGEQLVEVSVWTRYYGKGYERGDALFLMNVAEWLETRLGEVYYGGDSSGVCATKFDAKARAELKAHFFKVGHRPYYGGFSDGAHKRHCDFCDEAMVQYGLGHRYASFGCSGCGLEEETIDDGKTWKRKKEKL